jgi:hypothetical protein
VSFIKRAVIKIDSQRVVLDQEPMEFAGSIRHEGEGETRVKAELELHFMVFQYMIE